MDFINAGLAKGLFSLVIDRVFRFSEIADAHAYLEKGNLFGKCIVRVD